jgi:hypothetical protein
MTRQNAEVQLMVKQSEGSQQKSNSIWLPGRPYWIVAAAVIEPNYAKMQVTFVNAFIVIWMKRKVYDAIRTTDGVLT